MLILCLPLPSGFSPQDPRVLQHRRGRWFMLPFSEARFCLGGVTGSGGSSASPAFLGRASTKVFFTLFALLGFFVCFFGHRFWKTGKTPGAVTVPARTLLHRCDDGVCRGICPLCREGRWTPLSPLLLGPSSATLSGQATATSDGSGLSVEVGPSGSLCRPFMWPEADPTS